MGRLETTDSGKLATETVGQTRYVADYYRYFAGLTDKIEGAVLPIDKPDMHVYTQRAPIGVVAAIVPWNAQMFLTATKLGPALAAGCAIVLKASEIAPAPMLHFAKLIEQAGFPAGVVSVITGVAEGCAIPLTRHPKVDRIALLAALKPRAMWCAIPQKILRSLPWNWAGNPLFWSLKMQTRTAPPMA